MGYNRRHPEALAEGSHNIYFYVEILSPHPIPSPSREGNAKVEQLLKTLAAKYLPIPALERIILAA